MGHLPAAAAVSKLVHELNVCTATLTSMVSTRWSPDALDKHLKTALRWHTEVPKQQCVGGQVNLLRGHPQSGWDMRTVRELLQRVGVNMAALLERHEVIAACQKQLDQLPQPVGLALHRPAAPDTKGTLWIYAEIQTNPSNRELHNQSNGLVFWLYQDSRPEGKSDM